jgi:hypothetical protein
MAEFPYLVVVEAASQEEADLAIDALLAESGLRYGNIDADLDPPPA